MRFEIAAPETTGKLPKSVHSFYEQNMVVPVSSFFGFECKWGAELPIFKKGK